jgi:hypothetical protein
VELVRLYSNPQATPEILLHLRRRALSHRRVCEETARPVTQWVERRLGLELINLVVTEYKTGTSPTRLAVHYGIGKGTVLRLLREHDVAIRHRGLRRCQR